MAHSAILSSRNFQVGGSEVDSLDQRVQCGSLHISLKDNCVLCRLIGTWSVFSVMKRQCCAASTYTFAVFVAVIRGSGPATLMTTLDASFLLYRLKTWTLPTLL